jgi:hypothetical protein
MFGAMTRGNWSRRNRSSGHSSPRWFLIAGDRGICAAAACTGFWAKSLRRAWTLIVGTGMASEYVTDNIFSETR